MALTDLNKIAIAYKKLLGKAHTDGRAGVLSEAIGSTVQLGSETVFADLIPASPDRTDSATVGSVFGDSVQLVEFILDPILSSEFNATGALGDEQAQQGISIHAYALKLPLDYDAGNSPYNVHPLVGTEPFISGKDLTKTLGKLQIVPERYGQLDINNVNPYTPAVYTSTNDRFGALDAEDWFLDTYAGVLFLQDKGRIPATVKAYLYIGEFLSDKAGVAGGTEGTIQFNSGSLITGSTNLVYDYEQGILSGTIAQFNQLTASTITADSINVLGKITATEFEIVTVTSSSFVVETSGSTRFGNTAGGPEEDTHVFSGSVIVTGSVIEIKPGGYFSGSGLGLTDLKIGEPEDGTYTDGLFDDFTSQTFIGTAIDRINEVIKGLAPKPASDLDNIQYSSTEAAARELYISFDSTHPASYNSVAYENVDKGFTNLTNKTFTQKFSSIVLSGQTNKIRLGVLNTPEDLAIILNDNKAADGANFPADSFRVSPDGVGSFNMFVNSTTTPLNTLNTQNTSSANAANFNLSKAEPGTFNSTGAEFDLFWHRTGTATIQSNAWKPGYNYAFITHDYGSTTTVTTYVDWVYDPYANGTIENYNFTGGSITNFMTPSPSTRYISGIEYYTAGNFTFNINTNNYYKYTYPKDSANGGRTITYTPAKVLNTQAGTPADPAAATDVLSTSVNTTVSSNTSLLNETISVQMAVNNGFLTAPKNATSTAVTTPAIWVDTYGDTSTQITSTGGALEDFTHETHRMTQEYTTAAALASAAARDSSTLLSDGELIVYNSTLRHPTKIALNGNLTTLPESAGIPTNTRTINYSGLNGESQYKYYRRFINNTGQALPNIRLQFGSVTSTTFVATNQGLSGNNVMVLIETYDADGNRRGLRDAMYASGESVSGIFGTIAGLRNSAASTATTLSIQFPSGTGLLATGNVANVNYFSVLIVSGPAWQGSIGSLTILAGS